MIRQAYESQKEESRKGDFVNLVTKDKRELNIDLNDNDIKEKGKKEWKTFIDHKIKQAALEYLNDENSRMEKTKEIVFDELKMSDYLFENKESSITRIIFSMRSGTLDLKVWNPWKYSDLLCVGCGKVDENIAHFTCCETYGEETKCDNWKDIYIPNVHVQYKIAQNVRKRLQLRETILEADTVGQDLNPGSHAPRDC